MMFQKRIKLKERLMNSKVLVSLGVLILSGCSSTEHNVQVKVNNQIQAKNTIYATLKKGGDGSYSFDKMSLSSMKNSINLNSLVHNYPTQESECKKSLNDWKVAPLCREDALFTTSTLDGGDLVKNTLGNVFLASFTMGTGITGFYTARFDHEAYDKALNQALSKIDRESLIKNANIIVSKHESTLSNGLSEFNSLRKNIDNKINISVKVVDNSQLYSERPSVTSKVYGRFKSNLDISGTWDNLKALDNKLTSQVKTSLNYSEIRLVCNDLSDFNIKVTGCDQTWKHSANENVKPITYVISSAKTYTFFPTINANDKNVIIRSKEDGQIEITNTTDSFITLSSLSLYLGDEIETMSNLGLELPPGAISKKMHMSGFQIYSKNRKIYSVVKSDLDKKIVVGLASKYKIIDTNLEKTIYKKSNFKYSDLGATKA